ncbi:hypothetical protein ABZV81_04450 [Streptomyces parvus]
MTAQHDIAAERELWDIYDAVYSAFGAAWFTDPAEIFPQGRLHRA